MVLMGVGLVINLVVFLASVGFDDEVTPFIGVAVVFFAITFLVWRFDAIWSRILGLVAALGLFAMTFFFAFGVLQFFSPVEFSTGLAFLLGVVFAVVGGVRAIVAGIKDRKASDGEARLRKRVVTGLVALTIVSVVGFFFMRTSVSEAEASGAVELEMFNFAFDPEITAVAAGGKLVIHNSDVATHDFTLDELGIAVDILPGADALVDLSDAAPGTYDFVCTLHVDPSTGEGMTGELSITG